MRSDIADYGLADALPAPHAATLALAMLSTRLARLDGEVQERLINWGYAACDAGLRAHVDELAARAGRLPLSGRRGRRVRLELKQLAPWVFGQGQLRRYTQDSPVMPDVWMAYGDADRDERARPAARAASRGGRGRAGARAAARPDHGRPAGHAARLQPVARRGRADLRGARARRAADVALVAREPVAARTPTTWPGADRAPARDHRRPREPDARAGPARGRRRAAGRADLVRRHRRAHRVGAAARPRATPSPPTRSRRPASPTS